ncbi:S9 family peptidase [Aliiglaciecola sp. LCG003]|uniref:alpha/beta hydrolase family protein n=1 Tax=Aliiglaciecola sp. LCG003 TaxID=3053655 RepID=UPI0025723587|nr:S9 family peptidase [Aliiglaciecola sp. LCG003]WJG09856.1 S9 family peptidase [Aliiglaciecola sp. LCG003]
MKTLLCFCFILLTSLVHSAEIPLNDFVRHGDYLDMKISPDGNHLLARARADGLVGLFFLDAKTMKIVGGVRPRENDSIHSAQWINNERVVFQYAEKHSDFDTPMATGELYAVNIDGSKSEMLFGYRAGQSSGGSRMEKRKSTRATPYIISSLEGDDDNILIIEHPWSLKQNVLYDLRENKPVISKLNIYNGRKRKVETLSHPDATVLATSNGNVNFMSWSDNQNKVFSAYRKNADSDWVDLKTAFGTEQTFIPLTINQTSDKVYLKGRSGEQRFANVYELDLATGKLTEIFSDLDMDLISWSFDPVSNQPIMAYSHPNKTKYHYPNSDTPKIKLHKMLVEAFDNQTVIVTSQSEDGQFLLVHVQSDINPGEFYIFDTKAMNARFLWANRSWLDPRQMQPKQPFKFTTSDQVEVKGYLTMPQSEDSSKKPPMVVMIHGGPHGPFDRWEFDSEVQLLANRGYAVLQVNFRGSGGYGKVFEEMGYRQWGGKMIADINEATQFIIEQDKVDGNRICAYGASYGGYAALMSVIRAPDLYQCTIGYVGIYNLHYMYSESDTMQYIGGEAAIEKYIGRDTAQLNEFSPINHVDKIKAEVMLIHGDKDARVPVINANKMHTALEAQGKKVPYLNFGKSGHGVYDEEGRKELYQALLDFLDVNIGNAATN